MFIVQVIIISLLFHHCVPLKSHWTNCCCCSYYKSPSSLSFPLSLLVPSLFAAFAVFAVFAVFAAFAVCRFRCFCCLRCVRHLCRFRCFCCLRCVRHLRRLRCLCCFVIFAVSAAVTVRCRVTGESPPSLFAVYCCRCLYCLLLSLFAAESLENRRLHFSLCSLFTVSAVCRCHCRRCLLSSLYPLPHCPLHHCFHRCPCRPSELLQCSIRKCRKGIQKSGDAREEMRRSKEQVV